MKIINPILNCAAATLFVVGTFLSPAQADEARLDGLFTELAQEELPNWEKVERKIWKEWSQSGSPAMDLLLNRGRKAMSQGDYAKAVDHFSSIIDYAPEFAEAWNARATAFFAWDRYGLSISDIQQTLVLNPRHFGAMQGLGRILEEMGDSENALSAYKAAIAIHPHRPGLISSIERLETKISGQDI